VDLRKESKYFRSQLKKVSFKEIEKAYWDVVRFLDDKYEMESKQTFFEDILVGVLKSKTNKTIFRSFWIGNRNIDIFIPYVSLGIQSNSRGLAIEVDGEIHNSYRKMIRDESKSDLLHSLRLNVVVIENHDFNHPVVSNLLNNIVSFKGSDFRSRRRLLRNIYLKTLIMNKGHVYKQNIHRARGILEILGYER